MDNEEILMKEADILAGLLALDKMKADTVITRRVVIMREVGGKKKKYLEFRVRPISEEESQECHKRATKFAKTKPGQPRIPLETNASLFRSHVIYAATLDEDRAKVWDNRKALESMNLLQGVDMIERLLLAGEKARVMLDIDEISGYVLEAEELAKN
jgi:hypothetical protein